MKDFRVGAVIEMVCDKLKINYKSPNHGKLLERQKDAEKLADIYLQLKTIEGDLIEIEEKYKNINGISKMLKVDINKLDEIDHDLILEARKIIRRKR